MQKGKPNVFIVIIYNTPEQIVGPCRMQVYRLGTYQCPQFIFQFVAPVAVMFHSISVLPVVIFSLIISVIGSLHLLIVLCYGAQKFSNDSHFLHPVHPVNQVQHHSLSRLGKVSKSQQHQQRNSGLCLGDCRV